MTASPLEFTLARNLNPASDEVRAQILADPGFGRFHTDHMVSIDYSDGRWHDAQVLPYGLLDQTQQIQLYTYIGTRMGMAAAGDSHRRFGLEHQIDQFLALYEEIAADWHIAQANVRPATLQKPQKSGKQ